MVVCYNACYKGCSATTSGLASLQYQEAEDKMVQEKKGVAFTSGITKDGWQISVTERADSSVDAYANLEKTIATMVGDGVQPFVSYYNKAEPAQPESKYPPNPQEPVSVLAQAEQLGGVVVDQYPITPDESASIASGLEVPVREIAIPEGHVYLGVKSSKLEEIRENDSYQVLAETYSYDGTWVNFFNGAGNMSVAGSYYANPTGQKIFQEMFHWSPALAEKAPLPSGNVLLYILGVNSKGTVYQNIKAVEPA